VLIVPISYQNKCFDSVHLPSQNSPSNLPNPVAYDFQSRSKVTDPSFLRWKTLTIETTLLLLLLHSSSFTHQPSSSVGFHIAINRDGSWATEQVVCDVNIVFAALCLTEQLVIFAASWD
jgi:hypothetical protein